MSIKTRLKRLEDKTPGRGFYLPRGEGETLDEARARWPMLPVHNGVLGWYVPGPVPPHMIPPEATHHDLRAILSGLAPSGTFEQWKERASEYQGTHCPA